MTIDVRRSTWSTERVWGKAFTFAVAASVGPSDIAACATCAASVHETAIVESERYAPVPTVPSASAGSSRVALRSGDVIEEDETGHVRAIRHATTPVTWTRFKAGATSPRDADWVWGEIER